MTLLFISPVGLLINLLIIAIVFFAVKALLKRFL